MKTIALSIAAAVLLAGAANAAPANAPRPKDLTNPPRAVAATDYLLELGDIKGESKAVALDKVEWRAMPTAGCSGKLGPGDLTIGGDLSAVRSGTHVKEATLTARKAGAGNAMTIKLYDILVTSATPAAAQNSSAVVSLGKLGRVEYGGGSWSKMGCRG